MIFQVSNEQSSTFKNKKNYSNISMSSGRKLIFKMFTLRWINFDTIVRHVQ